MRIKSNEFRVREGAKVNLKEWPTRVDPVYATKEEYQDLLSTHVKALSAQQEVLYASDRYAVLLILVVISLSSLWLDIVHPAPNPF